MCGIVGAVAQRDIVPDLLEGSGYFDFAISRLGLLTGTYDLSAAIQDEYSTVTYDWWFDGHRFEVLPAEVYESEGVITTFGKWSQTEVPNRKSRG